MTRTSEDHVQTYLRRLNHELRGLPRAARREVLEEVSGHIEEARADGPVETEADVRNVLDRLGSPEEIASDARERFGVRPRGGGVHEVAAIVLLLFGAFVFGIGWIVGLVLLWTSRAWTVWDKLIGSLIPPGGLAVTLFLFTTQSLGEDCIAISATGECTRSEPGASWLALVLFVAIALVPIGASVYLALRMRRPAPPRAPIATPTLP